MNSVPFRPLLTALFAAAALAGSTTVGTLSASASGHSDATTMSGTSMTAPHATGAAAQHLGVNPRDTPAPAGHSVTNPGNQSTMRLDSVSLQMLATGGSSPYTWSATGLPLELAIHPTTGLISGLARGVGTFSVTVTASTAADSASTSFTWRVNAEPCPRCLAG